MASLTLVVYNFQAVHRFWDRNDVKGAIGAMEKMADHGVSLLFLKLFPLFYLPKLDIVCVKVNLLDQS